MSFKSGFATLDSAPTPPQVVVPHVLTNSDILARSALIVGVVVIGIVSFFYGADMYRGYIFQSYLQKSQNHMKTLATGSKKELSTVRGMTNASMKAIRYTQVTALLARGESKGLESRCQLIIQEAASAKPVDMAPINREIALHQLAGTKPDPSVVVAWAGHKALVSCKMAF